MQENEFRLENDEDPREELQKRFRELSSEECKEKTNMAEANLRGSAMQIELPRNSKIDPERIFAKIIMWNDA